LIDATYLLPQASADTKVITTNDLQPNALNALKSPSAYWWNGNAIVPMPYWTCAWTGDTVQGSLQSISGWTIPDTATLTVAGQVFTADVSTYGAVQFPLTLHPSVVTQNITAVVSAVNTTPGTMNLGMGNVQTIGLQVVGSPPMVAPSGPGSLEFLQEWASVTSGSIVGSLQSLMLADVSLFTVVSAILAWASTQPNPLDVSTLSPVFDWLQENVLSAIPSLSDLMTNGKPSMALIQMALQATSSSAGLQQYLQAVASIPNLE
jgi:hypothetical protein